MAPKTIPGVVQAWPAQRMKSMELQTMKTKTRIATAAIVAHECSKRGLPDEPGHVLDTNVRAREQSVADHAHIHTYTTPHHTTPHHTNVHKIRIDNPACALKCPLPCQPHPHVPVTLAVLRGMLPNFVTVISPTTHTHAQRCEK
jgi:hypothetical protein